MKRLALFFHRSPRERGLWIEAVLWLIWAKFLVHGVPFRWVAPRIGRNNVETPATITPAERALAGEISWAVEAAARHVPLGFVCLPQAMAAKWMLRRRHLPSTLYLGVATDPTRKASLLAHAWLRAGDKIVTGAAEAQRHRKLAAFGDPPDAT